MEKSTEPGISSISLKHLNAMLKMMPEAHRSEFVEKIFHSLSPGASAAVEAIRNHRLSDLSGDAEMLPPLSPTGSSSVVKTEQPDTTKPPEKKYAKTQASAADAGPQVSPRSADAALAPAGVDKAPSPVKATDSSPASAATGAASSGAPRPGPRRKNAPRRTWSPELHRHFVIAWNTILEAGHTPSPKKLMIVMRDNGAPMSDLTIRQVQSHHQKFKLKLAKRMEQQGGDPTKADGLTPAAVPPATLGGLNGLALGGLNGLGALGGLSNGFALGMSMSMESNGSDYGDLDQGSEEDFGSVGSFGGGSGYGPGRSMSMDAVGNGPRLTGGFHLGRSLSMDSSTSDLDPWPETEAAADRWSSLNWAAGRGLVRPPGPPTGFPLASSLSMESTGSSWSETGELGSELDELTMDSTSEHGLAGLRGTPSTSHSSFAAASRSSSFGPVTPGLGAGTMIPPAAFNKRSPGSSGVFHPGLMGSPATLMGAAGPGFLPGVAPPVPNFANAVPFPAFPHGMPLTPHLLATAMGGSPSGLAATESFISGGSFSTPDIPLPGRLRRMSAGQAAMLSRQLTPSPAAAVSFDSTTDALGRTDRTRQPAVSPAAAQNASVDIGGRSAEAQPSQPAGTKGALGGVPPLSDLTALPRPAASTDAPHLSEGPVAPLSSSAAAPVLGSSMGATALPASGGIQLSPAVASGGIQLSPALPFSPPPPVSFEASDLLQSMSDPCMLLDSTQLDSLVASTLDLLIPPGASSNWLNELAGHSPSSPARDLRFSAGDCSWADLRSSEFSSSPVATAALPSPPLFRD
eukprot:TRINITY_DN14310_c0_g1_i1.p1 TRINITY_DN14310_c0_g1~~TRINITY_DN14310_c0_g1_i1.p1  ORF type:complete len:802 (-),score=240.24 TRINITY_DN14310_c0_g1_i1:913-3318(-)